MKKIMFSFMGFLVLSCLLASPVGAQTLNFNQIVYTSSPDTVPAGKVWKIERIMNTVGGNRLFSIDGDALGYIGPNSSGISVAAGGSVDVLTPGPIWLKAGQILNGSADLRYSIIEFTVTP